MGKRWSMMNKRPPYVMNPAAAANETKTRKHELAICKAQRLFEHCSNFHCIRAQREPPMHDRPVRTVRVQTERKQ